MSATVAPTVFNRSPQPTAPRGPSAIDVERIYVPFSADIAQLANVIERLLNSGAKQQNRSTATRPSQRQTSTCFSTDIEGVM